MITGRDKHNQKAHAQLLRDRACLYLRHGFSVAETAKAIGRPRRFVYDARAKGGRDAVPLPVVTGDPLFDEQTRARLIDAPFTGLDTPEELAREALRLFAAVEKKAAEGDRTATFIQDSMIGCLTELDAYARRRGA